MNKPMEQIENLEKCKGKTIKKIEYEDSDSIIIFFEDDTFVRFIPIYTDNCGIGIHNPNYDPFSLDYLNLEED